MAVKVMVVDERKAPVRRPYVVRLSGWTLERYLREAPPPRSPELLD
ncbi:hypothetical protein ACVNPS_06885 [Candidatus Bipolaricaulota sp. J31]